MGLIPPFAWLHLTVGIAGTLIMVYTFTQRLLKERFLISEVLAATVVGILVGPYVGSIFVPAAIGDSTGTHFQVLQEVSRLVVAVQLVSAGLGLPRLYVEKRWRSLLVMLLPIMLTTWMLSFVLTVLFLGGGGGVGFTTLQCLLIAACLTPTDPVLASTVLQGRFAEQHLPAPLRCLLQAEAGANDGIALPYVMLSIILIMPSQSLGQDLFSWFTEVWLYEVLLAVVVGVAYGLLARVLETAAVRYNLIDEPSFLAHVIGLALGAVGLVRSIGSSGVLAVFVATIAFSSREPTAEESRYDAINGIELILTITYFIYFGAYLPFRAWANIGVARLALYSCAVLLLKRLPAVLAFSPFIPQLRQEEGGKRAMISQAAFAGFYGPVGVGALFYSTQAYEELKEDSYFHVISFVVFASIIIHGVSAAPLSRLLSHSLQKAKEEGASALAVGDTWTAGEEESAAGLDPESPSSFSGSAADALCDDYHEAPMAPPPPPAPPAKDTSPV
eukprot:jgi/Mesen1/480/ME000101S10699